MKKLLGMLNAFLGFSAESYGTELEKYIASHNPQDTGDVERLALEYNRKLKEGFLWTLSKTCFEIYLNLFKQSKNIKQIKWNDIRSPH